MTIRTRTFLAGFFSGALRVVSAMIHTFSAVSECCRFRPSCSVYFGEAVCSHGVLYGSWLGVRRLMRCGPWSEGGFDAVPHKRPVAQRVRS